MVNLDADDTDLVKYFNVQRYRKNKSGMLALSIYCAVLFVRKPPSPVVLCKLTHLFCSCAMDMI